MPGHDRVFVASDFEPDQLRLIKRKIHQAGGAIKAIRNGSRIAIVKAPAYFGNVISIPLDYPRPEYHNFSTIVVLWRFCGLYETKGPRPEGRPKFQFVKVFGVNYLDACQTEGRMLPPEHPSVANMELKVNFVPTDPYWHDELGWGRLAFLQAQDDVVRPLPIEGAITDEAAENEDEAEDNLVDVEDGDGDSEEDDEGDDEEPLTRDDKEGDEKTKETDKEVEEEEEKEEEEGEEEDIDEFEVMLREEMTKIGSTQ